jgi:hypothetical protein
LDELEQPFLSGPLVQTNGNCAKHGLELHCDAVHGEHFLTHDVTSQQPLHMCWVGQKLAFAEHPPAAAPVRHSYGLATAQRFVDSQTACEHEPLQLKRAGQAEREQHEVQNLVLFHASALAAHPPWLGPDSQ